MPPRRKQPAASATPARTWAAWWLAAPLLACVAAYMSWGMRGAAPPPPPPPAPLAMDVNVPGMSPPVEVGPGPGWRACQERFHAGQRFITQTWAWDEWRPRTVEEPGWWQPTALQRQVADELGVELLLVPGLSPPWRCTEATRCGDTLRGLRGDAVLAVPKGWAPGGEGSPPAARRRMIYTHGARFVRLSPFTPGFPLVAARLAADSRGPVLIHDYTLAPVGTWRDALLDTLAATRWLLAWDGRIGGEVCRPGECAAAAQRAMQAPRGLAEEAPSFEQLLSQRAAAPGAAPVLLAAGDSSGGALLLQFLLALTQRRYTPPGAEDLVQAALAFAPYTEPLLCLGPSYVTIAWCADPQWGVATGDPDYASPRMPFSQAWAEHRDRMRGWLRGNGSDGGGAAPPLDAVDWAVANPLWAPPEVLRQLPPLTIQVGTSDKYLAEDLEFAQRVARAGARNVQVDVYDGMWHAFWMSLPGCGGGPLDAAETSLQRSGAFLRAATGEPDAFPPWPERLGWPRVEYFGRWPNEAQRAAVAQSFYDP